MDPEELYKKIKKAETLRKKPSFPASMFWGPDYFSSGDLFDEIAFASEEIEDKEKYYNEAAVTYLLNKNEYGHYRAGEIYKKLSDLFERLNPEKSLGYLQKYGQNLEKAERYLIAGQVYMKMAGRYEDISRDEAISYYKKAYETFKKDSGCPYHMKEAMQKCLDLQLKNKEIERAIETFDQLNIKFSKLCRNILCLIIGRPINDDLESIQESELMMGLVNKTGPQCIDLLDSFSCENYLPGYAKTVFDMAADKFKPENDIC